MSMPEIAEMKKDSDEAINLLITSIAFEEFALSNVINAEAEKIQFVLEPSKDHRPKEPVNIEQLIQLNKEVGKVLKKVIDKEIVLEFMLEDAIELKENHRKSH